MIQHERESIIKCDEIESRSFSETIALMDLRLIKSEDKFLEFDLINVDCSIANALRRILIDEVETYAIDKVTFCEYLGALPEETIAHRFGLIPVHIDPENCPDEMKDIIFTLSIKNTSKSIITVYSHNIQPCEYFKPGVIITQLAPGQYIGIEMTIAKGTGSMHSKWSPVCPATYRLMPLIVIDDVYEDNALKLQKLFPEGVIGIRNVDGLIEAYVENARLDFVSREVLRHEEFNGRVYLGRIPNHFIFTIESQYINPILLLKRAILKLIQKAMQLKEDIIMKDEQN